MSTPSSENGPEHACDGRKRGTPTNETIYKLNSMIFGLTFHSRTATVVRITVYYGVAPLTHQIFDQALYGMVRAAAPWMG